MNRLHTWALSLLVVVFAAGCAMLEREQGWVTLIDGTSASLANWNQIGKARWRVEDGAIVGDQGPGFLISKNSYKDFQIRAEFWASEDANSGIFMRMADMQKISSTNSYEVNIFDKRPDPTYGTGAIVGFAKVSPMPKAGGRWNTYDITAKGPHLVVVLNGEKTVDITDSKFTEGPFSLQAAGGVIKWRKVQVRPL